MYIDYCVLILGCSLLAFCVIIFPRLSAVILSGDFLQHADVFVFVCQELVISCAIVSADGKSITYCQCKTLSVAGVSVGP